MPKKRINLEIKPCCHNCKLYGANDCKYLPDNRNPCHDWSPDHYWFMRKLNAFTRKINKETKQQ